MKKYTFEVQNKRIYDYDRRELVSIDYNPKITIDILQSLRDDFERGFDGVRRNFAESFKVLEKSVKDTLTIETNIDFDFTNFEKIEINTTIIPMRKTSFTSFTFELKIKE